MGDLYIGLLSGTSMDAIDTAIVDFDLQPTLIATHSHKIPIELKDIIASLIVSRNIDSKILNEADKQLGYLFAEAVNQLLDEANVSAKHITAIGSHGQTIHHCPDTDPPYSLQIGNATMIAEKTGITTVADFRTADILAGGQGAPLAPLFHHRFMRSDNVDRAIVNIGGIANVTLLPKDDSFILGFDTGPGNTLLDAWTKQHKNKSYDENGQWAAQGKTDQNLLRKLLSDSFFERSPPKSTGTDYFNLQWLYPTLNKQKPEDIQTTLTELTAQTIVNAIGKQQWTNAEIIVCGGGVRNQFLMQRLQCLARKNIILSSSDLGFEPDWLEAILFAWLAKLRLTKQKVDTRKITGASKKILLGDVFLF